MKRYFIVALSLIFILGSLWFPNYPVSAGKGGDLCYNITWSPDRYSAAISPGGSQQAIISFTSNKDLVDVNLFIVPELEPFISISNTYFSQVLAYTKNNVEITINVPVDEMPSSSYEGVIFIKIDKRVIPQNLKIQLYIAPDLDTVGESSYNSNMDLSDEALLYYDQYSSTFGPVQASSMVVTWLQQQPDILDAGILDDGNIWITYKIGLNWVISTSPPGMNGSGVNSFTLDNNEQASLGVSEITFPSNKKALVLCPFHSQPQRTNPSDQVADVLTDCAYSVEKAYDGAVTVDLIKNLYQYGIINWSTHGVLYHGKVILATGEETSWQSALSHLWDLELGRIAGYTVEYDTVNHINKKYWCIFPSFINAHADQPYPQSLIQTDACEGLANSSMAQAFVDNGAYVYLGWDKHVRSSVATGVTNDFFQGLSESKTVEQSYDDLEAAGEIVDNISGGKFGFYPTNHGDFRIKSQEPLATWDKTFGGINQDEGWYAQQTSDGGYIIAGYTRSYGAGSSDAWLIKTDSNGNKEWDNTFGGIYNDYGHSVQQTSDGGYIIAGYTLSYGAGSSDAWLIKTDASGDEVWSNTFGDSGWDYATFAKQTTDGGYIIAAHTSPPGGGNYDAWLIKTDAGGDEVWSNTFGDSGDDHGWSVEQTSDGGYAMVGYTSSYGNGNYDAWLIKTDAGGDEVWSNTFGGSDYDYGNSVQQTSDGGYIIAGDTRSYGDGDYDVWLIKTDAGGDEVWINTFDGLDWDFGNSVQQTADGGYIIAGGTGSIIHNYDVWLIKTDAGGDEVWSNTFGDSGSDCSNSVQQTSDGGYIIAGYTQSYGAGGSDVWLIKTDADGNKY